MGDSKGWRRTSCTSYINPLPYDSVRTSPFTCPLTLLPLLLAYALPLSPLCRYSAPAAHMGMRLPDHAMPGAGGGELQGPGACRTDMAMGPQASSMSRTQPAAAFAEPYVPVKMRLCVLCKTGFIYEYRA
jgi:hypothetical protein